MGSRFRFVRRALVGRYASVYRYSNLQYLNTKANIRLIQLIDADDVKPDGSMSLVALTISDQRVDGSTGVIELAHQNGLMVNTWTFRNDASGYGFSDANDEMQFYLRLGVDGVFTDFPVTGVQALAGIP